MQEIESQVGEPQAQVAANPDEDDAPYNPEPSDANPTDANPTDPNLPDSGTVNQNFNNEAYNPQSYESEAYNPEAAYSTANYQAATHPYSTNYTYNSEPYYHAQENYEKTAYGNVENTGGDKKSGVVIQTNTKIEDIVVEPETFNVFVGDLTTDVMEEDIKEIFDGCGEIQAINVIRDSRSKQCKGYAFIHFATKEAQERSLTEDFNGKSIRGRPCRVKLSEHKTVLFVGNVPMDLTEEEVVDSITKLCSSITSDVHVELKTGPPPQKKSRGFCFATFSTHPIADACKKILSASSLSGRQLNVSWAETTINREVDDETMSKVTTLYVSNLSTTVQEDVLRIFFSQFGDIAKCVIVKNPYTGEPRGFAFVQFKERLSCDAALEALNNIEFAGQKLAVVLAKPPVDGGAVRRKSGKGFGRKGWVGGGSTSLPSGGNTSGKGSRGRRGGNSNSVTWDQTSNWGTYNPAAWSQASAWNQQGNWTQATGWNSAWNQSFPTPGFGANQSQYSMPGYPFGSYGYSSQTQSQSTQTGTQTQGQTTGSRYGPY